MSYTSYLAFCLMLPFYIWAATGWRMPPD